MEYKELEVKVLEWAKEKGILEKATTAKQAYKTLEESGELLNSIGADNKEEICDSLGDILVTIIIQAKLQKVDLIDCLEGAYNVISKRNGKMINGTFVKN